MWLEVVVIAGVVVVGVVVSSMSGIVGIGWWLATGWRRKA